MQAQNQRMPHCFTDSQVTHSTPLFLNLFSTRVLNLAYNHCVRNDNNVKNNEGARQDRYSKAAH